MYFTTHGLKMVAEELKICEWRSNGNYFKPIKVLPSKQTASLNLNNNSLIKYYKFKVTK